MVKFRYWIASLFCIYCMTTHASSKLQLLLKDTEVELGQSIDAQLVSVGLDASLSQIDLSPLEKNFGVVVKESGSESIDNTAATRRQFLVIQLFPRKVGTITIPPLLFNNETTATASVIAHDAKIRGQTVSLEWTVSETSVWERQQIIVKAELHTPEQFAVVDIGEKPVPGMEFMVLPVEKRRIKTAASNETQFFITWLLYPQQYPQTSSVRKIVLPVVNYRSQGLLKRQFYLPNIEISVKPLPIYIPPTIPVGEVTIRSELLSHAPLTTTGPSYWMITLQSHELLPHWLPPVLRQIKTDDQTKMLAIDSQRQTQADENGALATAVHKIPFMPLSSGTVELPSLRVQFFDPKSGMLKTVVTAPITTYALNPLWIQLAIVVGIAAALVLLWSCGVRIKYSISRHRKIRHALNAIAQAGDPYTLRQALKQYAKAKGWPENLTLNDLFQYWRSQKRRTELTMQQTLQQLSDSCYGKGDIVDFVSFRTRVVQCLRTK